MKQFPIPRFHLDNPLCFFIRVVHTYSVIPKKYYFKRTVLSLLVKLSLAVPSATSDSSLVFQIVCHLPPNSNASQQKETLKAQICCLCLNRDANCTKGLYFLV